MKACDWTNPTPSYYISAVVSMCGLHSFTYFGGVYVIDCRFKHYKTDNMDRAHFIPADVVLYLTDCNTADADLFHALVTSGFDVASSLVASSS